MGVFFKHHELDKQKNPPPNLNLYTCFYLRLHLNLFARCNEGKWGANECYLSICTLCG
jgi:hypothetical protein